MEDGKASTSVGVNFCVEEDQEECLSAGWAPDCFLQVCCGKSLIDKCNKAHEYKINWKIYRKVKIGKTGDTCALRDK